MIKSTFLLALILISTSTLFGQDDKIEFEFVKMELEKGSNLQIESAFKVEDGYIVLKKEVIRGPGGFHYFLEKFDDNLKSVDLHDISGQFEHDKFIIDGVYKIKDSYILVSTKNYKEEMKEELYAQVFDWESGSLKKPELLYSQSYERRRRRIDYGISNSPDENFLLLTVHPPYIRGEKEKVVFHVLDSELEHIWELEDLEFEEEDRAYNILQTSLGNNGQIYLLGSKHTPRDRKAGIKRSPNEYEIRTITDDGQEINAIDVGNKTIDNIALSSGEKGEFYVGGYYRKEDGIGIDGIFLMTLNKKTGEIEEEIWDEFSQEFITEGWSDRALKKAKKKEDKGIDLGLTNLKFRRVVRHNDGSITMVGEVFWITTSTTTDANGNTTTHTTYHYGDLVATRISQEGEVLSHTRYNKHHTYSGAYIYFNLNNDLAIMLSQSRLATLDIDLEGMPRSEKKKHRGNALTFVKISQDGEITTSAIIDYKDSEYEGYRAYKTIRRDASIIEEENSVEVLLTTYFGKKKFGICRVKLE